MAWTHRDDASNPMLGRVPVTASLPSLADGSATRLMTAEEALASPDRLLSLEAHAVGAVVALVPASAAVFMTMSRRRDVEGGVALIEPGSTLDVPALWDRYVKHAQAFDPFAAHVLSAPDATVLMLPQVEAGAPQDADDLRAVGWDDRLVIYLRAWGTIVALILLVRTADRARFTSADASALRRVQPLLERMWETAIHANGHGMRDVLLRSGLTEREVDVAELAARGASNADIARSLYLSEATVKTHLTHVFAKLSVRTRTQLAILAGGYEPDR